MSILSRLLGTFQTTFQIGKGGPKIKNASGVIEARDAADSAYADVKGADALFTTMVLNSFATIKADVSDGIVVFRNGADGANAIARAADPVGSADLVTLNYFDNNAPASANTVKALVIASGNYATTYTSAAVLPKENAVTRCVVVVSTPLTGATTLSVGTDEAGQASRFMTIGENDVTAAGTYEVSPFRAVGSATNQSLRVTLSGTPSAGTVAVFIEYVVPTAW